VNVRDILDVKVICESGSLRRAAAVLGVTQPTLSNRIAHLEDQLGAPLFDRSHGQSRPTDLALLIAGRAGAVSDEAARLSRDVKRIASGQGGLVRIGLGPAPTRTLLAGIVATVNERHPQISLEMASGQTRQLAEWLVNREVDVVVCPPIEPEVAAIQSELLLETGIVVVARPDHPMFADPPTSITRLFKHPIATPFLEPRYLEILRLDYGIDLHAQAGRVVCSDFEMLVRVVSNSSRLFTAGPRFAFAPEIAAGRLKVLETPVPFKHIIFMHTNSDAYPLPAVVRVREIIGQAFVEIRKQHG
jgi:DNA-binding transcriptional LysR family regulator